jgi:hypothetical protein
MTPTAAMVDIRVQVEVNLTFPSCFTVSQAPLHLCCTFTSSVMDHTSRAMAVKAYGRANDQGATRTLSIPVDLLLCNCLCSGGGYPEDPQRSDPGLLVDLH